MKKQKKLENISFCRIFFIFAASQPAHRWAWGDFIGKDVY
jgi:hypothetical protein